MKKGKFPENKKQRHEREKPGELPTTPCTACPRNQKGCFQGNQRTFLETSWTVET